MGNIFKSIYRTFFPGETLRANDIRDLSANASVSGVSAKLANDKSLSGTRSIVPLPCAQKAVPFRVVDASVLFYSSAAYCYVELVDGVVLNGPSDPYAEITADDVLAAGSQEAVTAQENPTTVSVTAYVSDITSYPTYATVFASFEFSAFVVCTSSDSVTAAPYGTFAGLACYFEDQELPDDYFFVPVARVFFDTSAQSVTTVIQIREGWLSA